MKIYLKSLLILLLFCTKAVLAGEQLHQSIHWIETDKILLQGLDKVSARVFTAEVYVNQKVHFGSLEIYVRNANRSPPEDQPESICFVEIFDNKPGQQRQQVFSGWMFASNPALSALEHPVYDIWIKEAIVPEEVLKERLLTEEALIEEGEKLFSEQEENVQKEALERKEEILKKGKTEEKKQNEVSLNPNEEPSEDEGGF